MPPNRLEISLNSLCGPGNALYPGEVQPLQNQKDLNFFNRLTQKISLWGMAFFNWLKGCFIYLKRRIKPDLPAKPDLSARVKPSPHPNRLQKDGSQEILQAVSGIYFSERRLKDLKNLFQSILLPEDIVDIDARQIRNVDQETFGSQHKMTVVYEENKKLQIEFLDNNSLISEIGNFLAEVITSVNLPQELEIELTGSDSAKQIKIKGLSIDIQKDPVKLQDLSQRLQHIYKIFQKGQDIPKNLERVFNVLTDRSKLKNRMIQSLIPKTLHFDLSIDLQKFVFAGEQNDSIDSDWRLVLNFKHQPQSGERVIGGVFSFFSKDIQELQKAVCTTFLSQLHLDYFNNNSRITSAK